MAKRKDEGAFRAAVDGAARAGIPVQEVEKHTLNMMTDNRTHQGLVLDADPLDFTDVKVLPAWDGAPGAAASCCPLRRPRCHRACGATLPPPVTMLLPVRRRGAARVGGVGRGDGPAELWGGAPLGALPRRGGRGDVPAQLRAPLAGRQQGVLRRHGGAARLQRQEPPAAPRGVLCERLGRRGPRLTLATHLLRPAAPPRTRQAESAREAVTECRAACPPPRSRRGGRGWGARAAVRRVLRLQGDAAHHRCVWLRGEGPQDQRPQGAQPVARPHPAASAALKRVRRRG